MPKLPYVMHWSETILTSLSLSLNFWKLLFWFPFVFGDWFEVLTIIVHKHYRHKPFFCLKNWCNEVAVILPPGLTVIIPLISMSDKVLNTFPPTLSAANRLHVDQSRAGEKRMKMLIVMMTVITTVISSVFWYKLIKTASFCTIQGHFSSRKDSCNHPFCFPVPSVFPLACIRINLGSFILIISYLQNWQSQKRTTETKLILKISQSIHLYNSIPLE